MKPDEVPESVVKAMEKAMVEAIWHLQQARNSGDDASDNYLRIATAHVITAWQQHEKAVLEAEFRDAAQEHRRRMIHSPEKP